MSRGFFAIGIEAGKTEENVGGLWRSAHAFGATYIFTIGARYPRRQATDTSKAWRSIPLIEYVDLEQFLANGPKDAALIGVENDRHCQEPRDLGSFDHPERAVYILGSEDRGLPRETQERCDALVQIPTALCLNVATTGSIVLYDRTTKAASHAYA